MGKQCYARHAVALSAVLTVLVACLSGCSPSTTASIPAPATPSATASPLAPTGPVWGLPFQTGTQVELGPKGLHDDNFNSVPGASGTIVLNGAASVQDASLDLIPTGSAVPVIPLASGTVISAWPQCHTVVVDHSTVESRVWVEYLHLSVEVTTGQAVTRDTVLGHTTTNVATGEPCREKSEGANGQPVEHVHFAFLTGSGTTGSYISMVGRTFCGRYTVSASAGGAIGGLASAPGQAFPVPDCPGTAPSSASPTPTSSPGRLSAPQLLWPSNGFVGTRARIGSFRWQAVPGAATYSLFLQPLNPGQTACPAFPGLMPYLHIPTTSIAITQILTIVGPTTCWAVVAVDSSGHNGSPPSQAWAFRIVG
jgi:hypothetical protein